MNKEVNVNFKEVLFLLVITAISVLLRGYKYRITFMLPYTYKYLDPTLFTKDIAFFNYNLNLFFQMNAYLSKFFSYETIFFVGYFISSALLVFGVYYLTKTLFKNKNISYLAVILVIFVKPAISAMTTVWNYYYYKDIAMGLILISFAFFLRKRYNWSFLLLGIASLMHILFSLYFVGFYGFYFLVQFVKTRKIEIKKLILPTFILILFLIGPTYLILSSEQPTTSQEDFQSWLTILKTRSFDHFFPSTWITNSVIMFLPLFTLFLLFLYFVHTKKEGFHPRNFKDELYSLFGYVIILGIFAVLFSEIFPIRMLIIVQLLRPTIFLTFLAIIFGSYLIITVLERFYKTRKWHFALIGSALFVSLFYYDLKLLLLILPVILVLTLKPTLLRLMSKRIYNFLKYSVEAITGLLFALCVYSYFNSSFLYLGFYGEQALKLNFMSYVLLIIVLIGIFLLKVISNPKQLLNKVPKGVYLILTLIFVVSFIYAVNQSTINSDDPYYVANEKLDFTEHFQYPKFAETSMYNLSVWAGENTDKDALFMLPVQCGSDFRNFAKRSVFADFKYGTMSTFSIDFGIKWFERIKDLNPERQHNYHTFYKDIQEDYQNLSQERVVYLAKKYQIDYLVFEKTKTFDFPKAYENENFVLYNLRQIG
jgi:hypothetical protein